MKRKVHTINFIKNEASAEQIVIILADKLDNVRSINDDLKRLGPLIWKRFNRGIDDQSWYYKTLLSEFKIREKELDTKFADLVSILEKEVNEVFLTDKFGRSILQTNLE